MNHCSSGEWYRWRVLTYYYTEEQSVCSSRTASMLLENLTDLLQLTALWAVVLSPPPPSPVFFGINESKDRRGGVAARSSHGRSHGDFLLNTLSQILLFIRLCLTSPFQWIRSAPRMTCTWPLLSLAWRTAWCWNGTTSKWTSGAMTTLQVCCGFDWMYWPQV